MNIFIIFLILIVITALLLIAIIMVQNPKGGGLDSTFGGGSGMMIGGVKQTTDFLEKATWTLFGLMIGLILLSNTVIFKQKQTPEELAVPEAIEQPVQAPQQAPAQTAPTSENQKPSGQEQQKSK